MSVGQKLDEKGALNPYNPTNLYPGRTEFHPTSRGHIFETS